MDKTNKQSLLPFLSYFIKITILAIWRFVKKVVLYNIDRNEH